MSRPNQWAYYSSMEEVEGLLEALNPRGHRESGLREALLQERDRLQLLLDGNAGAVLGCQGTANHGLAVVALLLPGANVLHANVLHANVLHADALHPNVAPC